jgi:hypothetical protein
LQQNNSAEPTPEQVKILLENLGQLQKTPNKEKQKDSNTGVMEMTEPDNKDSGG